MRKQKQRTSKSGGNVAKSSTLTLQEGLRMFGPVIGVVVAFISIIIHLKFYQLSPATQKHEENGQCILAKPYVYNYTAGFLQRDLNIQKYAFPYSSSTIDRRSRMSIQEFWEVYDAKWYLFYYILVFFSLLHLVPGPIELFLVPASAPRLV